MGLTKKKHYESYTLAFKVKAVRESKKRGVRAVDVATALGIHPVMLYRWCQEHKEGRLSENKHMQIKPPPAKKSREDSDALKRAVTRIKELEKRLASKEEEVVILKKAKRFFSDRRKKNTRS
jgi:transposase